MPKNLDTRYGDELLTYYSGNPLNRLSWLRDDYPFLDKVLHSSKSRFIVLDGLCPLLVKIPKENRTGRESHNVIYVGYDDVKTIVGEPFAKTEADFISEWESERDAVGRGRAALVFLGIREEPEGSEKADPFISEHTDGRFHGVAYFAVDVTVTQIRNDDLAERVRQVGNDLKDKHPDSDYTSPQIQARLGGSLDPSVFAQARCYLDWIERNQFCGGCGHKTMVINGGNKLVCPEKDGGVECKDCPTRGRITYLSFPRTDCCVIMLVVNKEGDKILLGRSKRFPPGMYSCLAGFIEPAESLEDAVRREVFEESGVKAKRVVVYGTQPWPFPGNIMVGCIAQADLDDPRSEEINLGLDPELADAQWFSVEDAKKWLQKAQTSRGLRRGSVSEGEHDVHLPPPEAIAFNLIDAVLHKNVLADSKI